MNFGGLVRSSRTAVAVLGIILHLSSTPGFAQKMVFSPTCGQAGVTKVCVTGSGWAEPSPVCYYRFYFDGAQVVFPDQPDGLFGPPRRSFTVPAGAAAGDHPIKVDLRITSNNQLLQSKQSGDSFFDFTPPFFHTIPAFKVAAAVGADQATTMNTADGTGITLTFKPVAGGCDSTCKRVVWIQVVQRFAVKMGDTDAQAVITMATDWPGFPDADKKVKDETPDANRARVDRIWGRTFPYYGVDNTSFFGLFGGVPPAGSMNAGGTITVGSTGTMPNNSTMFDAPNTPAGNFPPTIGGVPVVKAILKFEAAPFCVEGDEVGKLLGKVVSWELHQNKGGVPMVQNAGVTMGQPSGKFTDALNQWIKGNPNTGPPFDRNPFDLPKPPPSPCP